VIEQFSFGTCSLFDKCLVDMNISFQQRKKIGKPSKIEELDLPIQQ